MWQFSPQSAVTPQAFDPSNSKCRKGQNRSNVASIDHSSQTDWFPVNWRFYDPTGIHMCGTFHLPMLLYSFLVKHVVWLKKQKWNEIYRNIWVPKTFIYPTADAHFWEFSGMSRGQKCDHLGMITTTAIIIIQRHYDPHSWTLSMAHTLRKVIIIISV